MNETARPASSSSESFFAETPRAKELNWLCERIAQRTAKLVLDELAEQEPTPRPGGWTTAAQVAEHLGVSTDVVYERASQLGSIRLGDGPKARLRFPPLGQIDELLRGTTFRSAGRASDEAQSRSAAPVAPRHRRRLSGTAAPLLPIAGEDEPHSTSFRDPIGGSRCTERSTE